MEPDLIDRTPGSDRYRLESSVAQMLDSLFEAADAHREADAEGKQRIFSGLTQAF